MHREMRGLEDYYKDACHTLGFPVRQHIQTSLAEGAPTIVLRPPLSAEVESRGVRQSHGERDSVSGEVQRRQQEASDDLRALSLSLSLMCEDTEGIGRHYVHETLERLDLDYCRLSASALSHLTRTLMQGRIALSSLSLVNCGLEDTHMAILSVYLPLASLGRLSLARTVAGVPCNALPIPSALSAKSKAFSSTLFGLARTVFSECKRSKALSATLTPVSVRDSHLAQSLSRSLSLSQTSEDRERERETGVVGPSLLPILAALSPALSPTGHPTETFTERERERERERVGPPRGLRHLDISGYTLSDADVCLLRDILCHHGCSLESVSVSLWGRHRERDTENKREGKREGEEDSLTVRKRCVRDILHCMERRGRERDRGFGCLRTLRLGFCEICIVESDEERREREVERERESYVEDMRQDPLQIGSLSLSTGDPRDARSLSLSLSNGSFSQSRSQREREREAANMYSSTILSPSTQRGGEREALGEVEGGSPLIRVLRAQGRFDRARDARARIEAAVRERELEEERQIERELQRRRSVRATIETIRTLNIRHSSPMYTGRVSNDHSMMRHTYTGGYPVGASTGGSMSSSGGSLSHSHYRGMEREMGREEDFALSHTYPERQRERERETHEEADGGAVPHGVVKVLRDSICGLSVSDLRGVGEREGVVQDRERALRRSKSPPVPVMPRVPDYTMEREGTGYASEREETGTGYADETLSSAHHEVSPLQEQHAGTQGENQDREGEMERERGTSEVEEEAPANPVETMVRDRQTQRERERMDTADLLVLMQDMVWEAEGWEAGLNA
ncbi:hypothetical protein KIPB_003637 [Kipferlia bialata]|uniref:Uncharacterized protein n=1 Tax=Kipferlia bialata TaxID=797122 RepID=A0A9K3CT80_9EUKA|nr:hypothetical protein KIPB_003637 [Kipferlia bialata]|eukprot:g3637.t1